MTERRFGVRIRVSWGRCRDLGMAMEVMRVWNFWYLEREETRQQRPTAATDPFNGFLRIRKCLY